MPGFDRTGPAGMGPRTGGGFGLCAPGRNPASLQGFGNFLRGAGRGFRPWGGGRGRAWGGGRGRRWDGVYGGPWYGSQSFPGMGYPSAAFESMTPEQELQDLRNHAMAIEQDLKAIHKNIAELESESGKSDPEK